MDPTKLGFPVLTKHEQFAFVLDNGDKIHDASCGAGAAILGNMTHIHELHSRLMCETVMSSTKSFNTASAKQAKETLLDTTKTDVEGQRVMDHAFIYSSSGSDAMESAIKIVSHYHIKNGETKRTKFIALEPSYHGSTAITLALGAHHERRKGYEHLFPDNVFHHIAAHNPAFDQYGGEPLSECIRRSATSLVELIEAEGPHMFAGLCMETISGNTLGYLPMPEELWSSLVAIARAYDILVVVDDVMAGMRTDYFHSWQRFKEAPDISVLGKGLGGGLLPATAVLCNGKVAKNLGGFVHGFTLDDHPPTCAVVTQTVTLVQGCLDKVKELGPKILSLLQQGLEKHPHVGAIRGRGRFFGIVFVLNKDGMVPFDASLEIYKHFHDYALRIHKIFVYAGQGSLSGRKDGCFHFRGDHVHFGPAVDCPDELVMTMAGLLVDAIHGFNFGQFAKFLK